MRKYFTKNYCSITFSSSKKLTGNAAGEYTMHTSRFFRIDVRIYRCSYKKDLSANLLNSFCYNRYSLIDLINGRVGK